MKIHLHLQDNGVFRLFTESSRRPQPMSTLSMRDLCRKIWRAILPSAEDCVKEKDERVTIRRRIEVIIETETVSLIVPCHPGITPDQAGRKGVSLIRQLEPAAQGPNEVKDAVEPPNNLPSE